jgi:hypothetical protein
MGHGHNWECMLEFVTDSQSSRYKIYHINNDNNKDVIESRTAYLLEFNRSLFFFLNKFNRSILLRERTV